MTAYTEGQLPLEALQWEAHPLMSRQNVTIVSGSGVVEAGTVLGKITASGKYEPYDDGNSGGSNAAVAVSLYKVDATSADVSVTAIVRLAGIKKDALQWKSGNDATSKSAAYTNLATLNIIAI